MRILFWDEFTVFKVYYSFMGCGCYYADGIIYSGETESEYDCD